MGSLKKERAAEVLIAAMFTSDAKACQQYGVSLWLLQRWRRQLADGDPELTGFVAAKKKSHDALWAERMPSALNTAIQAIEKSFTEIGSAPRVCKNPTVLHTLAGASRIVADVHLTCKVIEARIASPSCFGPGQEKWRWIFSN